MTVWTRSTVARVVAFVLWVSPFLSSAVLGAQGATVEETFSFDGPTAAMARIVLPEGGRVNLGFYVHASEGAYEVDYASMIYFTNGTSSALTIDTAMSSVAVETRLDVGPLQAGSKPLPGPGGWVRGSFNYTIPADSGTWTWVAIFGTNIPVDAVEFWGDDPASGSISWVFTHATQLLTARDFTTSAYARALHFGASVALQGAAGFDASGTVFGFSHYIPEGTEVAGVHDFTLASPRGAEPADDLQFLGDMPGQYDFTLTQAHAGAWPGRAWVLYADFPLLGP